MAELQQRLASAESRWKTLTGLSSPADLREPTSLPTDAEHPELALARLEVERARAQLEAVRHVPPRSSGSRLELETGARGRRPGTPDSVGVVLRIPFGTDARSGRQKRSALGARRASASGATAQGTSSRRGKHRPASARQHEQQVAKEQARLALLRERAQLLDKSFRAGETPLPDLLRASPRLRKPRARWRASCRRSAWRAPGSTKLSE